MVISLGALRAVAIAVTTVGDQFRRGLCRTAWSLADCANRLSHALRPENPKFMRLRGAERPFRVTRVGLTMSEPIQLYP